MIGARDMAFPRLNALSFWLFLGSGCFIYTGLFLGDGPNAGWFDYVPLALRQYDPGLGRRLLRARADLQRALVDSRRRRTSSSRSSSCARPGMSLNRMPLFCFANLAASLALVFALPPLTVDLVFLELERKLRLPLLRRRARRPAAAVAGPVLDLRPPRGLHHRPAGVRDRDLDHPDLRAAAHARLPARRARRAARRLHRLRRLGAPHVRDRAADHDAGLLRRRLDDGRDPLDDPDLRLDADRRQRPARSSRRRCCSWAASSSSSSSAASPGSCSRRSRSTRRRPTPTSSSPTSTSSSSARPSSRCSAGSTTGSRRSPGGCTTSAVAVASFWVTAVGTFTTFFPMHIVGLLGMTRRVYTYEAGLGWGIYNLIETVGGFVLAAGILADRRQPRLERAHGASAAGPTRSSAARSSGRCPRRRRTTTSPSSRASRAPTRTGTAPTATPTSAGSARDEPSLAGGHLTPTSTVARRAARRGGRDARRVAPGRSSSRSA